MASGLAARLKPIDLLPIELLEWNTYSSLGTNLRIGSTACLPSASSPKAWRSQEEALSI
jgi:hypothetical protein